MEKGGAIYVYGLGLILENTTFINNEAKFGGSDIYFSSAIGISNFIVDTSKFS